jgi:hypothetical protein
VFPAADINMYLVFLSFTSKRVLNYLLKISVSFHTTFAAVAHIAALLRDTKNKMKFLTLPGETVRLVLLINKAHIKKSISLLP